jgi:hypothetical protein
LPKTEYNWTTFPSPSADSTFPDIDGRLKTWAREEIYWSFVVLNVYLPAVRERGKENALGLLKDGGGYFLGAKIWVPFSPPRRAFILYLCWEQANLRNNAVVLKSLSDTVAVVEIQTSFLAVYDIAGHLKPVISPTDYRRIFETLRQDRAGKAGWELKISYHENYVVILGFHRNS